MSSPDFTGARQRKADTTDGAESPNPASLSTNRSREVPRNKPVVKPPFADVTMGKFLTYLVFGLLSVAAFYTWRFTVWAADAGGYWNLVTGHRSSPTGAAVGLAGEAAMKAAGSAVSAASSARSSHTGSGESTGSSGSGEPDIQGRIYDLANALGIKPADLSNAIRPLIDPSVPNPAEAAKQEADLLRAQLAGQGGAAKPAESAESHGSLLAALGEAVLD